MTILFVRRDRPNIVTFVLEGAYIDLNIAGSRIRVDEEARTENLVDDFYDDFLNTEYIFTNPEGSISISRDQEDDERRHINLNIKFGRISLKDWISVDAIDQLRRIMGGLIREQPPLQEGGKRKRKTRRSRN